MPRKHGMHGWLANSRVKPDAEPVQPLPRLSGRVIPADPEAAQRRSELAWKALVATTSGAMVAEQAQARGFFHSEPWRRPPPDEVVPLPKPPEFPPRPRVKFKRKGLKKRWSKT